MDQTPQVTPFTNLAEIKVGDNVTFLGDQKIVGWYHITRIDDPIDGVGVYGHYQSIYSHAEAVKPEKLVAEFGKPLPNRAPAKLVFS